MNREKDYYQILGIGRDADEAAVKDAFRDLALKFHPDRNQEPGAEERFKEIAEAYAVLSDPEKRSRYDAGGLGGLEGLSPEDLFAGIDLDDVFGGFARDFGFGSSIFDRFFRTTRPRRGVDLEVAIEVPLRLIATGGTHVIRIPHTTTCSRCRGDGAEPPSRPQACTACGGSGTVVTERRDGNVRVQQITTCTSCRGSGRRIDNPCRECGGRGAIDEPEDLRVRIPIGVEDGTALRIPGRGHPGPGDLPPGDLVVSIRAAPDADFRRRGADLWHTQVLPIEDAVLGTSVRVPTLGEPVTVTVPAGTQPGQILRLAKKGLPSPGASGRGDLMLVIHVAVPEHLNAEERHLFEELRRLHHSQPLEPAEAAP